MFRFKKNRPFKTFQGKQSEIEPDEIFLDSKNIPKFETEQFEGRLEKPISKNNFLFIGLFFALIGVVFLVRLGSLQITQGESFRERSEDNRLRSVVLLPNRGIIYDRNGKELAWNATSSRSYTDYKGLAHLLGYIGYPSQEDTKDIQELYSKEMKGKEGVEKSYNEILRGKSGLKLIETTADNKIASENIQRLPRDGGNIIVSIDAKIEDKLFRLIRQVADDRGFNGGAGVIIKPDSGELLALTSYPEYDSNVLSLGTQREKIQGYIKDRKKPFLNRAIAGLYAPGSILKPIIALGALNENIITPEKQIFSSGSISLPNPFFPEKKSIFYDWKAHGWVDMRRALAVSSNVYFYEIGGGYENQKGLGVKKIGKYAKMFGLGEKTGIDLEGEEMGLVPSPELKAKNKNDNIWRIGDTYNISIGQGDFQVTPIQMARVAGAIATGGKLPTPKLVADDKNKNILDKLFDTRLLIFPEENINITPEHFKVVREGMRMAVTDGTAKGLYFPNLEIAAKTGTAEIGSKYVNSWVIGFAPYEDPKIAFAIVLEKGRRENTIGALFVARQLFEWMLANTPEYLQN